MIYRVDLPGEGEWIDNKTYWTSVSSQGTPIWHKLRKRLTASNLSTAIGHSPYPDNTPYNLALEYIGIRKKIIPVYNQKLIDDGIKNEPIVRDWYARTRNVTVKETGLSIPKWDYRIGASLDGEIVGTDGIIEIKCPQKVYNPLRKHFESISHGWEIPPFYHDHINITHYDQIMMGLAVCNKVWCDYVVCGLQEKIVYVDRVYFNIHYWDNVLYPGINNYFTNILEPLMKQYNIT